MFGFSSRYEYDELSTHSSKVPWDVNIGEERGGDQVGIVKDLLCDFFSEFPLMAMKARHGYVTTHVRRWLWTSFWGPLKMSRNTTLDFHCQCSLSWEIGEFATWLALCSIDKWNNTIYNVHSL
jgi:hypothetical protein